jgi:hypothetical protein
MSEIFVLGQRPSEIDTSDFPDFYGYSKPLDRGLWVLWVAKEKLGTRCLWVQDLAKIMLDWKEVSVEPSALVKAFNRAQDKIHRYEDGSLEITKAGKDHLTARAKPGSTRLYYFEPGKRYTSKLVLSERVLANLKGELRILDPYCGERTLDILRKVEDTPVKFLTKIDNIGPPQRARFLRELKDFKSECSNVEFRDYGHGGLHDRYVISSESLVLMGHSMKDLGGKESFAVVLDKHACKDVVDILRLNFDSRWKRSICL